MVRDALCDSVRHSLVRACPSNDAASAEVAYGTTRKLRCHSLFRKPPILKGDVSIANDRRLVANRFESVAPIRIRSASNHGHVHCLVQQFFPFFGLRVGDTPKLNVQKRFWRSCSYSYRSECPFSACFEGDHFRRHLRQDTMDASDSCVLQGYRLNH